jgi:hypothetical protein
MEDNFTCDFEAGWRDIKMVRRNFMSTLRPVLFGASLAARHMYCIPVLDCTGIHYLIHVINGALPK